MKRKANDEAENGDRKDAKKKKYEDSVETSDDEEASSSASSSDEGSAIIPIAAARERRANAGNKMASLLEDTEQEDEFYKNTYGGGFLEDDQDDAFESPVESDHDDVDSDFYKTEEEDEPISDTEEKERPKRKSKYREPRLHDSDRQKLDKNRKWVMARMGGPTVAANTVSPETQADLLEEAKETERTNIASLKKYEQFELERRKKREKSNMVRAVKPPLIKVIDNRDGIRVVYPSLKELSKPEPKVKLLCAVTSRIAKYRDPITGLPYANVAAFKMIREKYTDYLKLLKNNSVVTAWLEENV